MGAGGHEERAQLVLTRGMDGRTVPRGMYVRKYRAGLIHARECGYPKPKECHNLRMPIPKGNLK